MADSLPADRYLSEGQRYLPGIYGGVGPLAHVLFEQQLLACRHRRGARTDQDYPVWLIVSASSTPNRMASLSGAGPSALPCLAHYAQLLQQAGADALVVACNTAHAYHAAVQRDLRIPWVHLMEITVAHIEKALEGVKRVGVLGTDGTLQTGLYHDALRARGLSAIAPALGSPEQDAVMAAIFDPTWGIKSTGATVAPKARRQLVEAAGWARARGAQAIIAACTEVSVGLTRESFPELPIVDPLEVAAEIVIDLAYGDRDPAEFFVTRD
jgi:aspartate racemase